MWLKALSHFLNWQSWSRIPNVKAHGSGVRINGMTFLPKIHITAFPLQLCFLSSYLLIQVTAPPFLIISELRVIHFYALWFIGSNFKTGSHQIWILQEIRATWRCKIKPVFWRVKSSESWQGFKGKTVAKIIQVKWWHWQKRANYIVLCTVSTWKQQSHIHDFSSYKCSKPSQ